MNLIDGGASLGRQVPSDAEFIPELARTMAAMAAAGQPFTAYSVTQALRNGHGNWDVMHQRVRPLVHEAMAALVASGDFVIEHRTYPTGTASATAITYVPGVMTVQVAAAPSAQVSAPAQSANSLLLPLPGQSSGQ